ncbi:hypothetical protein MG293_001632 [Ovis ammon polii]|uniref:Uncharacterized protein n=1 Tax=Ovis ammon polii TaxID=230172 RepID=A0AAD4UMN0_OVIAM|nr:hypothetical protein MG293_001632 [Ovis ammon polii]
MESPPGHKDTIFASPPSDSPLTKDFIEKAHLDLTGNFPTVKKKSLELKSEETIKDSVEEDGKVEGFHGSCIYTLANLSHGSYKLTTMSTPDSDLLLVLSIGHAPREQRAEKPADTVYTDFSVLQHRQGALLLLERLDLNLRGKTKVYKSARDMTITLTGKNSGPRICVG